MGRAYTFWNRLLGFYTGCFKITRNKPAARCQQAEQGYTVNSLQEAKLGDLAFFENTEGKIIHVGILLNNEKIIHASGKVKIDSIDEKGIFSEESKRYTHKLRTIKRMF